MLLTDISASTFVQSSDFIRLVRDTIVPQLVDKFMEDHGAEVLKQLDPQLISSAIQLEIVKRLLSK